MFTEIKFSEKGTNARVSEEQAYMNFINYLEVCEKGIPLHDCNTSVNLLVYCSPL